MLEIPLVKFGVRETSITLENDLWITFFFYFVKIPECLNDLQEMIADPKLVIEQNKKFQSNMVIK